MNSRIDLASFLENRKRRTEASSKSRALCLRCLQSEWTCYCGEVRPFDPRLKFVILIHPHEARRRIATGRMSHLCLVGSQLVTGDDFSENKTVNSVLADPGLHSVVLYPGKDSLNLSNTPLEERASSFPSEKELVVFVIDGTWRTARKMLRLSSNLGSLPRICFSPERLSRFRIRKQPAPECFSTIEAIHQTIELLGAARGFDLDSRRHDRLLDVFDSMVNRQLAYVSDR